MHHKTPEAIIDIYKRSECLYNIDQVHVAINDLAEQIDDKLADTNPVVLCAMVGGLVTTGQLLPYLDFPLELDYIHASRYGDKQSGGKLQWITHPRIDLKNRNILIIDDILDGGITLAKSYEYCNSQGCAAIYSAVLVEKIGTRDPEGLAQADFVGMQVPDKFVFGSGMDYHGYLRNAPGIFAAPEN